MKPIYKYSEILYGPEVGQSAHIIMAEQHPNLTEGNMNAVTSVVIRVGENGEFETFNSIYQKA